MITRSFLCKQSVALQTILLPRLAPHLLDALRLAWALYQDWILQIYSQAHHGEVVVGLGTVAMLFYIGLDGLNHILSRVELGITQEIEQTIVAELLLLEILSLIQSVGIDKQRTALDARNLLAFVFQAWEEAYRCIGNHLEEITIVIATSDYWRVVSGITEVQMASLQIQKSQEERYKHTALIVFTRESIVHAGTDLCRHHLLGSQRSEQSCRLCHEE